MLANRHVVVALLIAPVLAVLAWLAVDQLVGERARPAAAGESYPLIAKSNCRYASGRCTLENTDMSLDIVLDGSKVTLTANQNLEGAYLSVASDNEPPTPLPMTRISDDNWQLELAASPTSTEGLYLVVQTAGVTFYGEASTVFAQVE